jgi:hypothetical protein
MGPEGDQIAILDRRHEIAADVAVKDVQAVDSKHHDHQRGGENHRLWPMLGLDKHPDGTAEAFPSQADELFPVLLHRMERETNRPSDNTEKLKTSCRGMTKNIPHGKNNHVRRQKTSLDRHLELLAVGTRDFRPHPAPAAENRMHGLDRTGMIAMNQDVKLTGRTGREPVAAGAVTRMVDHADSPLQPGSRQEFSRFIPPREVEPETRHTDLVEEMLNSAPRGRPHGSRTRTPQPAARRHHSSRMTREADQPAAITKMITGKSPKARFTTP